MVLRLLRVPLPSPPIVGGVTEREAALVNPRKPVVGRALSSSELMSATLRFWPENEGDSIFSGGHWQIVAKSTVPSIFGKSVKVSGSVVEE